jgi:predicted metal-binding protein
LSDLNKEHLEDIFSQHGFTDFRWLPAKDIEVAQWVRMKCIYGCDGYGQSVACPPNNPPVLECERFIREYSESAIFHFIKVVRDDEEKRKWSREENKRLIDLERAVFLLGYRKAFMLLMGSCPFCEECVERPEDCRHPGSARPTPEGLGVDLFATAHSVGYPLEVLSNRSQQMNRYAILLIE